MYNHADPDRRRSYPEQAKPPYLRRDEIDWAIQTTNSSIATQTPQRQQATRRLNLLASTNFSEYCAKPSQSLLQKFI